MGKEKEEVDYSKVKESKLPFKLSVFDRLFLLVEMAGTVYNTYFFVLEGYWLDFDQDSFLNYIASILVFVGIAHVWTISIGFNTDIGSRNLEDFTSTSLARDALGMSQILDLSFDGGSLFVALYIFLTDDKGKKPDGSLDAQQLGLVSAAIAITCLSILGSAKLLFNLGARNFCESLLCPVEFVKSPCKAIYVLLVSAILVPFIPFRLLYDLFFVVFCCDTSRLYEREAVGKVAQEHHASLEEGKKANQGKSHTCCDVVWSGLTGGVGA